MTIISGIIVFVTVTFLMVTLSRKFGEKLKPRMPKSFIFGLAAGFICAFAPKLPVALGLLLTIPALAMMVYMILYWSANGSTVSELLLTILVDVMLMWTGFSAASRIHDLTSIYWVVGIVRVLPVVVFFISAGFFIYNFLYFREWINSDEFDPDEYGEDEDEDEGEAFVLNLKQKYS